MEERAREEKQARMADQSSTMENLPIHILIEIISRLSIKSVMAISSVCKSLLDIVSDSHFQILHSTRAPTELCYCGWGESSTTLSIAEYVFKDDSLTAVDKMKTSVFELPNFSVLSDDFSSFGATRSTLCLVNSCYGLVCFMGPSGDRFAVVCNPFTHEYIMLPCPARMDKTVERQCICYGLGFSPKDNKFKLLRLIYRKYQETGYVDGKSRIVGEIYTFGERGSWKMVANRPHLCMSGMEVVIFHEGALHWYCTSHNDDAIITFDFDTDLFGKLVTPPRMCDMRSFNVRWSLGIGVFEGCLYTTGCVGDYFDIWVLKEYGHDSWIKIFSIPKDVNSFIERYEPFKYVQNGEVLMFKNLQGTVCFNPNIGSVKHVDGICGRNGAVFIRPSLISLKVLLGDDVKVHSVKPWYRTKVATIPSVWTSSVAVKGVVKADKDSQGCVPGSSAPRSSSEASASTSHPTEVKNDVLTAILASQQGGHVGSFGSQDPRLHNDRCVGQSSSGTQKLDDEIEALKAEDEGKG